MRSSISSSEVRPATSAVALRILVVCFGMTLLIVTVATEMLVRAQVAPQDNRPQHLALLEATASADVAFGDSHVARGFDAQQGFINLAYPSENIADMLIKARHYFADHAPERVILQADPHLFAPYRLNAAPAVLEEKTPMLLAATPRHRPQLLAYWTSYFENGGQLRSTVQQTPAGSLLSSGDLSLDLPRLQMRDARMRIGSHRVARPDQVAIGQEQYRALVDFLAGQGARICFVTFPVSPAYAAAREAWPSNGHAEMIAFFESEAARVGGQYWDARTHVTDLSLFRDIDHLNAKGAVGFSQDLHTACGWGVD